ncbi:MAG: class I SAM-dependent methyltransferase [Candidatus Omnitrophica bacterium]|nr:class I SAM-dependent methyltransferase [Candidatus Omnitrophota bacterium]
MSFIKQGLRKALSQSETGKKILLCRDLSISDLKNLLAFRSHLGKMGWIRSVEEGLPVDESGQCLPWFTYPAITFLKNRIDPNMAIFEYGSGNSTLWWSKQVASIVSYEHDRSWFEAMENKVPENVDYHHSELEYGGDYSKAILNYQNQFDVIVVDGRDRINCVKNCLAALKPNGVVIFDNSDRVKYQEGYDFLLDKGFRRLDFEGHGPINSYSWCTSVFYRSDNCLDL